MKKILVLLLCVLMWVSFSSCEETVVPESNDSDSEQPSASVSDPDTKDELQETDASAWKNAYLNIIESRQDFDRPYTAYALVYVDGDDIPELYINGHDEAEGDIIYSYKNGNIFEQYLSRTLGGKYIERSGKIINQNGHMGYYYDHIYMLDDSGFTQTLNASYTEHYEDTENGNFTVNSIREYFINETPVSENDYNDAVNSSFDFTQSTKFYEKAVSYNEIKQKLTQDTLSYPFIGDETKKTWKNDILDILQNVLIHCDNHFSLGSFAIGLMDLDFDGTPELLAAHPGGSMGNKFIEIYDLKTKALLANYNAGHIDDETIYLCVAEKDGEFVILAEGYLRSFDYGWGYLIDIVTLNFDPDNKNIQLQNLFNKSEEDDDIFYFVEGNLVEKSVYDTKYEEFLEDYRKIDSTQIQLIRWSSFDEFDEFDGIDETDSEDRDRLVEAMAEALVSSSQEFIDFAN